MLRSRLRRALILVLPVAATGAACADSLPPACDGGGTPVSHGQADAALAEASGLSKSRVDADLFWTHEDRGNGAVLWALDATGATRGTVTLTGASATDWEDIALGTAPDGQAAIYVGDIGDNRADRAQVTVLRLVEPAAPTGSSTATADALHLRYPSGPVDAEGLAFDPATNQLVLVTKERGKARFFVADAHAAAGSTQDLLAAGELDLSSDAWKGGRKATALDISADGRFVALRTAAHVLLFPREDGQSFSEAIAEGPCRVTAPDEPDGEAIALGAGAVWTLSEGAGPTLWSVPVEGLP